MSDVVDRLRRAAPEAFEGSAVRFAYLFGSVARGRPHRGSDIDVAVYLDPPPADPVEAALALAGRLATASGLAGIDLVVLNAAPLRLQGRILRERVVIFSCDEPSRVAYESRTFREFVDFELHAVALDRAALRRMASGAE